MLTLTRETPLPGAERDSYCFRDARAVRLGRVEGNEVVLPVAHISSRHGVIRRREGGYAYADLGSTNGSAVERGGRRLLLGPRGEPEVALESGDVLVLGDIDDPVRMRVELGEAAAPSAGAGNTIVARRSREQSLTLSQRLTGGQSELQVLLRLVDTINRQQAGEQIVRQVAQAALDAIPGAVDALVVVRGPEGGLQVRAEAHRGQGLCRTPDATICERVLAGDAAVLFGQHDASSMPANTLARCGVGSGIAAPLWGDEQIMGALQINCEPGRHELRETHLDLAVVLAHHAAAALERAELIACLRAAEKRLAAENSLLRRRAQPRVEMVADSPAMARVVQELRRAAETDVTVLLSGETGTGKEVAARLVHEHSRRAGGLLVPVNCGALTESLLDSELFGHRKGAFTGATSDRKGVFEVAAGGTVFLDEIGETPLSLQVRLLRVLEESMIKVVGDAVERRVDVRIIAATNRDLGQLVEQGRFRQDLYYRLRVFPVTLPPLRERPEDIEPLVQLFVGRYARQLGKPIEGVEPALVAALRGYAFPGNVRELANEIERAVVRAEPNQPLTADLLSEDVVPVRAAPRAPEEPPGRRPLREQLAEVERGIIADALRRHDGRKSAAARELGLTRQGLAKKIERLGL